MFAAGQDHAALAKVRQLSLRSESSTPAHGAGLANNSRE